MLGCGDYCPSKDTKQPHVITRGSPSSLPLREGDVKCC